MDSLDPDTRKVLLARFIRDCELAKALAKPTLSEDHIEIKGKGTRATTPETSPKANKPKSCINPKPNGHPDKQAERGDPKDSSQEPVQSLIQPSSPTPEQSLHQGTSANINQGNSVDANPAVKGTSSAESSEVNKQETNQQSPPHSQGESPLTSQSESQSPRTTRAQKVSQLTRADKSKEFRVTRKSTRVTSHTHEQPNPNRQKLSGELRPDNDTQMHLDSCLLWQSVTELITCTDTSENFQLPAISSDASHFLKSSCPDTSGGSRTKYHSIFASRSPDATDFLDSSCPDTSGGSRTVFYRVWWSFGA
ncbi:uncharacterized protein MELLADRAFT_110492 [Melampsora larici-populina 98AG31]|uniref:Uncharacterized protein n=1 Tax=Melampsora larici-populina (strain 98AG31 / pathotype 3-4-7) TaxID=747676 RepID=F4RZZ8_MELLP|nr:uncharacterized protein MELLADRAFT_110492 [Melampsora larici-populina 98AG31]EGG02100.1 hypothetical protein MELLADRAFT_110492 [Melampsora larici-populina 98AG31]